MKNWILIIFAVVIIGCEKKNNEISTINFENVGLPCLYDEDLRFIIKSEDEYIQIAKQIYNEKFGGLYGCADTINAPIDFNKYILLGKYATWDTNDKIEKYVVEEKTRKTIIYIIKLIELEGPDTNGGFGKIYKSSMNWILIERPPDDFKVTINLLKM